MKLQWGNGVLWVGTDINRDGWGVQMYWNLTTSFGGHLEEFTSSYLNQAYLLWPSERRVRRSRLRWVPIFGWFKFPLP